MPRERHTCTIPGCDGPCVSGGLCDKHRKRKARYGDPLATKRIIGDDEARWWSHVDRRGADDCWPWTAWIDDDGYGRFWTGESVGYAARWGYERFAGPIADKHMPDHLCRHRACCNWSHLEPVTNRENVLRGVRTKLSDETVAVLYRLHTGGQSVAALAAFAGVDRTTLYRRFRRLG
jgi:hypothetical protein